MGKTENRAMTTEKKIQPISIDKIIPNCEQSRKLDETATQHLAESIRKIGLINPIEVTPRGDKYMLAGGGLDRVNAFKILGEKEIKAIIENLDDNEAAERALADNLCRRNYTSIELEEAIHKRWENGNYKTRRQLGESIGRSGGRIGLILDAREIRKRTNAPLIKLYKMVEEGRLDLGQVRDAAKNFNDWPEGAKNAVFESNVTYSKAKEIIDGRLPLLKELGNKIMKDYEKKETWKKILSENDDFDRADLFEKLFNLVRDLEPTYIREIKDETDRKWADNYIKSSIVLLSRLLFKLDKVTKVQFEMIAKVFKMDLKKAESLKNVGHDYDFSREWTTKEEREISEKIRKVKSGRTEPLKRVFGEIDRNPKSSGGG
jgi:ParB/RepB/Spo0J family partition protein